jgi:sugar/nucleoside kinase (ribokinase family)
VDIFLPNAREARKISATDDLDAAVEALAGLVPVVAVKLGPNGSMARRGKERFSSPAIPVEAVDPVGAGDSFDAGFLHQYVRGAGLAACLAHGNLAGAFSTTRAGGTEAFRDPDSLRHFLSQHWTEKANPARPATQAQQ